MDASQNRRVAFIFAGSKVVYDYEDPEVAQRFVEQLTHDGQLRDQSAPEALDQLFNVY